MVATILIMFYVASGAKEQETVTGTMYLSECSSRLPVPDATQTVDRDTAPLVDDTLRVLPCSRSDGADIQAGIFSLDMPYTTSFPITLRW